MFKSAGMPHRFLLTILHIYVLHYLSPPQAQSGLLPHSAGLGCLTYAFLHWPRTWVLWCCNGATGCKYSHFHQETLLLNQFAPAITCSQQDTTLSPPLHEHKKDKTSWVLVFLVSTCIASSQIYQLVPSIPAPPLTPSSRPQLHTRLNMYRQLCSCPGSATATTATPRHQWYDNAVPVDPLC